MDFGSKYVYIFMADAPYFYIQATNVVKNTKRATEFWKKKKKLFDYLFFVCLKFARLNGVSISSFYMRSCCSRPRKRATTVKTDGRVDANAGESSVSSQGNSCKSFLFLFFSRKNGVHQCHKNLSRIITLAEFYITWIVFAPAAT